MKTLIKNSSGEFESMVGLILFCEVFIEALHKSFCKHLVWYKSERRMGVSHWVDLLVCLSR